MESLSAEKGTAEPLSFRGARLLFTDCGAWQGHLIKVWRPDSFAKLLELQRLAIQSIGTEEPARLRGLTFEQSQLIAELELLQLHLEHLSLSWNRARSPNISHCA